MIRFINFSSYQCACGATVEQLIQPQYPYIILSDNLVMVGEVSPLLPLATSQHIIRAICQLTLNFSRATLTGKTNR